MLLRTLSLACATLLASAVSAQSGTQSPTQSGTPSAPPMPGMQTGAHPGGMAMEPMDSGKPMLSPPARASVTLGGQTLTITYHSPSLRGRHLGSSEIVPYDKVWRTGANPATTLTTPVSLHIGTLLVPAGTYTLYTLPSRSKWMLIVNRQTGQWGTVYDEGKDLGRTEMKSHEVESPQEVMSISFDDIEKTSAQMHIRWEKTDESVKISTP